MKQAKVKLPSGEYLIQESDNIGNTQSVLFPGNWRLLGADPTRLTEVEAGEIVEKVTVEINVPLRLGGPIRRGMFKNYTTGDQFNFACPVPTASLDSLAGSLGISKPFVVLKILRNEQSS